MPGSLAVSLALVIAVGNLGAIVGPLLLGFSKDQTGSYNMGILSLALSEVVFASCTFWVRYELKRLNRLEVLRELDRDDHSLEQDDHSLEQNDHSLEQDDHSLNQPHINEPDR